VVDRLLAFVYDLCVDLLHDDARALHEAQETILHVRRLRPPPADWPEALRRSALVAAERCRRWRDEGRPPIGSEIVEQMSELWCRVRSPR